jgi:hypothetical protein
MEAEEIIRHDLISSQPGTSAGPPSKTECVYMAVLLPAVANPPSAALTVGASVLR